MKRKEDFGKLFLGSVFLLSGIFALLGNFLKLPIFGILFLPSLGLIFIIWSILSKDSGLLIPGGILEGIGLGIVFVTSIKGVEELSKGGLFFIGFAIGWLLIVILSKLFFKKTVFWPLIPGAFMFIFGILIFLGTKGINFLKNLNLIWPIILIIAGSFIVFKFFREN